MIEYECYDCQSYFMTMDDEMYEKCPFCGCNDFYTLNEDEDV